jgi:hydrogenase maturation protease
VPAKGRRGLAPSAGSVIVIGLGNEDRGDDGVGPAVLAALEGKAPPGVRLLRLSGADPAQVLEAWQGIGRAFLVDAMVSGAPAGTVRCFDAVAAPLPPEVRLVSTHALGAGSAVELARALGRLPAALTVYGVEGATFTLGAGLSPAAAAGAAEVARRILEEVGDA